MGNTYTISSLLLYSIREAAHSLAPDKKILPDAERERENSRLSSVWNGFSVETEHIWLLNRNRGFGPFFHLVWCFCIYDDDKCLRIIPRHVVPASNEWVHAASSLGHWNIGTWNCGCIWETRRWNMKIGSLAFLFVCLFALAEQVLIPYIPTVCTLADYLGSVFLACSPYVDEMSRSDFSFQSLFRRCRIPPGKELITCYLQRSCLCCRLWLFGTCKLKIKQSPS
jgi:hypothetical protein